MSVWSLPEGEDKVKVDRFIFMVLFHNVKCHGLTPLGLSCNGTFGTIHDWGWNLPRPGEPYEPFYEPFAIEDIVWSPVLIPVTLYSTFPI